MALVFLSCGINGTTTLSIVKEIEEEFNSLTKGLLAVTFSFALQEEPGMNQAY